MDIRTATIQDLSKIAEVEQICFPAAEAASEEDIRKRLAVYPQHFLLLEDGGRLIGFVNGMVSDRSKLTDEMYEDAALHQEDGRWQMIFGLDVIPEYRGQGCAGRLLKELIKEAKEQQRKGLVLTCKEKLIHYYAAFGFVDEGVSQSVHGGVVWHDMRLSF